MIKITSISFAPSLLFSDGKWFQFQQNDINSQPQSDFPTPKLNNYCNPIVI